MCVCVCVCVISATSSSVVLIYHISHWGPCCLLIWQPFLTHTHTLTHTQTHTQTHTHTHTLIACQLVHRKRPYRWSELMKREREGNRIESSATTKAQPSPPPLHPPLLLLPPLLPPDRLKQPVCPSALHKHNDTGFKFDDICSYFYSKPFFKDTFWTFV